MLYIHKRSKAKVTQTSEVELRCLKNIILQKILENLHIFILQRESDIHGPYSWVSGDASFYFFAQWRSVHRATFLQFTLLSAGPPFVQGRSKWPPYYGDFMTMYFDHLGNDSRCSQSEWWMTTKVTIMQEVRRSPIPFCENFWGLNFSIIKYYTNFLQKLKLKLIVCDYLRWTGV